MKLKYIFNYLKDLLDNKKYSKKFKNPDVMNDVETINYILKEKCSISRFGDGELRLMRGIDLEFQKYNKVLSQKLKEVKTTEKCLTCIPDIFNEKHFNENIITEEEFNYWTSFKKHRGGLWNYYYKDIKPLGDAFLSRFYLRKKDKTKIASYVNCLKMLWDKRNVIFVEGEQSRLGYNNNLFENAKSIKRILCPPTNSFDKYEEIKSAILEMADKDDLIIMALGPTATILSYELSDKFQCLDLGHVDIEYEWFVRGVTKKIAIDSKYVNEVQEGRNPKDINEDSFNKQVIKRII